MTPRPVIHLQSAGSLYPAAWQQVEIFRQSRGVDLPRWPSWCFMPLAAWFAIVSQGKDMPPQLVGDVARLAAVGTWRYTKGIYRFDADVLVALKDTFLRGEIPSEVLLRLPEWCVYIETPGITWFDTPLLGFFAHLEWDANTGRKELRLLLDSESSLTGIPVHLGPWTVTEAMDRMAAESDKYRHHLGMQSALAGSDFVPAIAAQIQPLLSLLLYLCSDEPDIGDRQHPGEKPGLPQPKKTKRGWRLFEAEKPHQWNVGVQTGEALRQATAAPSDATGRKVSPHLRRAHWHGYWTGPRDGERTFKYVWLPPTLVAGEKQ